MTSYPHARYHPVAIIDDIEEEQPEFDMVELSDPSISYVCPECGDLWGKVYVYLLGRSDEGPRLGKFRPIIATCKGCGDGSMFQGYVCATDQPYYGDYFGPEIMKRELRIEYERNLPKDGPNG